MEGAYSDHARNLKSNLSNNQLLVDEVSTLKATVLLQSVELASMKTMIRQLLNDRGLGGNENETPRRRDLVERENENAETPSVSLNELEIRSQVTTPASVEEPQFVFVAPNIQSKPQVSCGIQSCIRTYGNDRSKGPLTQPT
jgi:hypothetical protein